MKKQWTGEASNSSGIILLIISLLLFSFSFNINLQLIRAIFPNNSNASINTDGKTRDDEFEYYYADDYQPENGLRGEILPNSLLLPLTIVPGIFWLTVKFVSLRLHLSN